jgi:hypothetical protein
MNGLMSWKTGHFEAIQSFLKYLNNSTNKFILKGGTALMMCYGLDRFSEDIDLDAMTEGIREIVAGFCDEHSFSYRVAKDTATVKRYMINYGNESKPLKIEVSYRKKDIRPDETDMINGICVYKIGSICLMKANAYAGRDRIRDLSDLVFICNKYWDELSDPIKTVARGAVEFKGIEQFDYLIREQADDLIDKNVLAEGFLIMYEKLGLLFDENERQIIDKALEQDGANHSMKML